MKQICANVNFRFNESSSKHQLVSFCRLWLVDDFIPTQFDKIQAICLRQYTLELVLAAVEGRICVYIVEYGL